MPSLSHENKPIPHGGTDKVRRTPVSNGRVLQVTLDSAAPGVLDGFVMVLLNGRFVPERRAVVSVFDRGFLYGDGLFETLRVRRGQPLFWEPHLDRFRAGAEVLRIRFPVPPGRLLVGARELIRRNRQPDGVLRLQLSRGPGVRGYSPRGATRPMLVMSTHPAPRLPAILPPRWRLMTSVWKMPAQDPITPMKTCNRLPFILARADAEAAGFDEALMLNTNGEAIGAAAGNLFWIEDGVVCTPSLEEGPLAGVTRRLVLRLCAALGLRTAERTATPEELRRRPGVFLTQTVWGIIEVAELDGSRIRRSPLVTKLFREYQTLLLEQHKASPEQSAHR
jgi:aminodeoxychorismate lyase